MIVISGSSYAVAAISSEQWGTTWRARSASLTGSEGRAPAGSRGTAPGQGSRGRSPPKRKEKWILITQ